MAFFSALKAFFGAGAPKRPQTRLSEAEALAIAKGALGPDVGLRVGDVVPTPAGMEWHIATVAIGSGEIVVVSDSTGDIIERRRWGVR